MSGIVEKLINLRDILSANEQKEAAQKVESVMKNIDNKEELHSLELALNIRAFGDLYLPMYDGDWWNVLNETRREVQELYFILESMEPEIEEQYVDMIGELYNVVKQIEDNKLLIRVERIVNDYSFPEMIKDVIKICQSQCGRPIKDINTKYGNWGQLIGELYYKANAYLKKIEFKNYSKAKEYVDELKKEMQKIF